jgi:hypothetical protein
MQQEIQVPRELTEEEMAAVGGGGLLDAVVGWLVGKALDAAVEALPAAVDAYNDAVAKGYGTTPKANPFGSGK